MNGLRVNKYIVDEIKQVLLDETRQLMDSVSQSVSQSISKSVIGLGVATPLHHGSRCLTQ